MDNRDQESFENFAGVRYRRRGIGPITLGPPATEDPQSTRPAPPARTVRRAITDVVVVVTVMAAVALLVVQPWLGTGSSPASRLALATYQGHPGGSYRSGQVVTLSWSRIPHVSAYRFQIARSPSIVLPAVVLVRPWRTIQTGQTSVRLRVEGPQIYYWRVQPYLGHAWAAWSLVRIFGVDRPVTAVPRLFKPRVGKLEQRSRITLCWSKVPSAAGYRLQIDRDVVTVAGTCRALALASGVHYWRVRALARGIGVFAGPATPLVRLTVAGQSSSRTRHVARTHHSHLPPASFPPVVPALSAPAPAVFVITGSGVSAAASQRRSVPVRRVPGSSTHPSPTHRNRTHHQVTSTAPGALSAAAVPHGAVESIPPIPVPPPPPRPVVPTTSASARPTTVPTPLGLVPPPPPPPPGG